MKSVIIRLLEFRQQYTIILLLLILFFRASTLFSQEEFVSGEYSILANDLMKTWAQYEYEALLGARENALEKAFGTSVMSSYERLTITEMQGRSVAYNSDKRSNYLNTFPNGVWIKDNKNECHETKDVNGNFWYSCKVTGYARKIESAPVKFKAFTLDGTDPLMDKSGTFVSGEDGYLYFKSPDDGFLIVFYDDMNTVQRCIPYNSMTENNFTVQNNREYIFFSTEKANYMDDVRKVDEIEFHTTKPIDYNQFYILFSPVMLAGYYINPPKVLEDGYSTFKSMDREYFQKWLQEQRIRNKDLQVHIIGVNITGTDGTGN